MSIHAKPSKKTVKITDLSSKIDVNVREANNYDLPVMMEQIVIVGKILKPIIVEETTDGELLVLSGNRRTRAGQELASDPNRIASILQMFADSEKDIARATEIRTNLAKMVDDVKEALNKVDIYVYRDLSVQQRLELIMDHGSEKPISRTELVKCIWRMDASFMSEAEIIRATYFSLAQYTGNTRKLGEVPTTDKERTKYLTTWFHGTVGNYILDAAKMGEYVREQFILTHRSEDGLLKEGEKVEMRVSRDRVKELRAAKGEDSKADKWSTEKGGPVFNALVEKFKAEDAGEIDKVSKKRPTVKELMDKSDVFKSTAVRKALQIAAGETGEKVAGLLEDDDRSYRNEQVLTMLARHIDKLPDEIAHFARKLCYDKPKDFEDFLESIATVSETA